MNCKSFLLITCIIIFFSACKKETNLQTAIGFNDHNDAIVAVHKIGDHYGGGIVFLVDSSGQRGIISDVQDLGVYPWQPTGAQVYTNAYKGGFGTGKANTIAIVKAYNPFDTTGYAAVICDKSIKNGFSDWYLPSRNELKQMYLRRNIIKNFKTDNPYWSSTALLINGDEYAAYGFSFLYGSEDAFHKLTPLNVRAIRYFYN